MVIECPGEQAQDVLGSVREVVANASHSAIVGDDPAAVAVDQSANSLRIAPAGSFCRDGPKGGETTDRLAWRAGRYDRQRCGRGGIGIRDGFRCHCSRELEGSSPSARTLVIVCWLTPYGLQSTSRLDRWPKGGEVQQGDRRFPRYPVM